jgi:hypothetical protein
MFTIKPRYLYRKGQKNRAIIEVDPALDDKFLEDDMQFSKEKGDFYC